MSQPITCGHCGKGKPYDRPYDISRDCRLCWLYHNDPVYREFWGGPPVEAISCRHRGGEVGRELCPSCKGHVEVKKFACAVHGTCTQARRLPSVPGCCQGCPEGPVVVVANAMGVGDALMGLCAVAGLKMASRNREVIYEVTQKHQEDWVRLFTGYDKLVLGQRPVVTGDRRLMQFQAPEAADVTLKKKSRWDYYAEAAGAPLCVVPPARPLPQDAVARARECRGAVVLSPYSVWEGRSWPVERWLALEKGLADRGTRCVVLDGFLGMAGTAAAAGFASPVVGYDPPLVAAILKEAPLFVGNDSGMAHAAGMMRTPAIVLNWFYSGFNTYSIYGQSHVIQAKAWRESITVEGVLAEAVRLLGGVA